MAAANPRAVEVLTVWAAPNSPQQFVLRTNWDDPGAWGLVLVDVARHVANAYAREGRDRSETLERIRELFDAEWAEPTDDPESLGR
jgi:hypothetical protein